MMMIVMIIIRSTLITAMVVASGCSSPREQPVNSNRKTGRIAMTSEAKPGNGGSPVVNELREIIEFLTADVTLEDITARIGPVAPGGDGEVVLHPTSASFKEAIVAGYPDTGKPYTLELGLANPIAVADLRAALGNYRRLRTDRGHPRQIVFYPPVTDRPFSIAVIGRINSDDDVASASVHHIILRRDPR